ncbi:DUF4403 family protein [Mucilaginibacter sp. PPCGB 2223]|uniref:DUF4403 family protein n=1 Tax=Mucilaginibacter sp. PPCGB 2223 TaxID=1886027 RepID=UPI0011122E3D|nr:DUF4403 family protein [Mucilaginibacter sp. PPCGB 2223]
MKAKYLITILLSSFGLYSCKTLQPLAPAASTASIPNIIQPVSNIEVPVTADLKSYFVQAENSVPNKYADNQQPCQGLRYSYTFTRTPFTITGANNIVNLKFIGSYGFTASYCAKCATLLSSGPQCVTPVISAQCGVGEPLRRMEISYQSTINVMPDYHLRSKTILYPAPNPLDRCNVFLGNIDVTDRLISYLNQPLNDLGKQVDAKIAAYNIKPMIEELWKSIAGEFKIPGVGYLYVNPQAVRLSNFNLSGTLLNFSVGLSAKPVVTTTSVSQPAKPLPDLSTYVPAKGFNVYLDLVENYEHLTSMINHEVTGQKIPAAGKVFIVDSTKVYGLGTKVAIKINFSGSNNGVIYLVGTPTYDAVKHELSFPDLSFDLQTRAWMLKAANWMFNGKITDVIRQKAIYNFTRFIADNKIRLQNQLSRNLGNNVHSDVTVQDMDIRAIFPTAEKLIVRTLLDGQVKVKVVM